jgi:hypothetical protein
MISYAVAMRPHSSYVTFLLRCGKSNHSPPYTVCSLVKSTQLTEVNSPSVIRQNTKIVELEVLSLLELLKT